MPPFPDPASAPSPAASRRLVRRAFLLCVLAATAAVSALAPVPAVATPGPAPTPVTKKVLADLHTDAVSTYFEGGELVLDTKADTPALGTRYSNDAVWFHVDDDSRYPGGNNGTYPAWPGGSLAFVAPAGATVWMAPMTQVQNQIWPGFSTEAIGSGVLLNNDITFTLQAVDGPGDVEVWTTGSFGAPNRLWSSDENVKSFTRKNNVHMHANWAFTQPGTYELTVRANAVVAATGAPTTDTAVYTFVVGDLPADVATSTTVAASDPTPAEGEPVTLSSTVTPAGVEGAVEFRDGSTVLGHEVVDASGDAELVVSGLAPGTHSIRAVFVPTIENLADPSTSGPLVVTVGPESSTFSVGDIQVAEGDSGSRKAVFTVTRTNAASSTASVKYATADGTAVAPGDYTKVAARSLSFAKGQTSKTVSVTVKPDVFAESDETFSLVLSAPVGATIADGQAIATIVNDDPPAPAASIADASITEGPSGNRNLVFTVTLTTPAPATVSLKYQTSNVTAVSPADYRGRNLTTLSIRKGTSSATIVIGVKGDRVIEPDETFRVLLSSPSAGVTIADGTAVGTIVNDD